MCEESSVEVLFWKPLYSQIVCLLANHDSVEKVCGHSQTPEFMFLERVGLGGLTN